MVFTGQKTQPRCQIRSGQLR